MVGFLITDKGTRVNWDGFVHSTRTAWCLFWVFTVTAIVWRVDLNPSFPNFLSLNIARSLPFFGPSSCSRRPIFLVERPAGGVGQLACQASLRFVLWPSFPEAKPPLPTCLGQIPPGRIISVVDRLCPIISVIILPFGHRVRIEKKQNN